MRKKIIICLSCGLVLSGCSWNASNSTLKQDSSRPVIGQNEKADHLNDFSKEPVRNNIQESEPSVENIEKKKSPQINSVVFDGNGVVIEGKNLEESYVAFTYPAPSNEENLCREITTPSCVLQKSVSTGTTIKFISNWIGSKGIYQVYVENQETGMSNKVDMLIK